MAAPLAAQATASSSPALEAPASTPAPDKKKDGHGISITFGDDSPSHADLRAKLTPDQLFKIELARAQNVGHSDSEDILVPAGFFLMIFGIVWVTVWARSRRNRLMHETARIFAEKGQPLPPEFFSGSKEAWGKAGDVSGGGGPPWKTKSDLRRGIFWVSVGLGLIGYFLADHDRSWGVGFIPLFIGLGYLLAWKLETPTKPGAGV